MPVTRRSPLAAAISLLVHVFIILLAIRLTAHAVIPDHSRLGDAIQFVLGGGGGGGGQQGTADEQAVASHPAPRVQPPPPAPPPPAPPSIIEPTVIPPPPPAVAPIAPPTAQMAEGTPTPGAASAGDGTGTGGGKGTGTGVGVGSGEGAGSGSGKGGGTGGGLGGFGPENLEMILPPTKGVPKEIRGVTLKVTFIVSAQGTVTGLDVEPPIENRSFAKRFDELMRGYRFKPGRDASGKPVAGVQVMQITLGSN